MAVYSKELPLQSVLQLGRGFVILSWTPRFLLASITDLKQHSPSWEGMDCSTSQEIILNLGNIKVVISVR